MIKFQDDSRAVHEKADMDARKNQRVDNDATDAERSENERLNKPVVPPASPKK